MSTRRRKSPGRPRRYIAAAAFTLLTAASPARAALQPGFVVVDQEHTDIGLGLAGGAWNLHVHADGGDYAADQALLNVNPNARVVMSSVPPSFAFTGAQPNQPFWVLPQTQDAQLLFLGLGAEGVAPGTF